MNSSNPVGANQPQPQNLHGFQKTNDPNHFKKQIQSTTDGKKYTLYIKFNPGSSSDDMEREFAKYDQLSTSIADFAKEMKLGDLNAKKHRTLTKLELGSLNAKGEPQLTKVYKPTDSNTPIRPKTYNFDTIEKKRTSSHKTTQQAKYGRASALFSQLFPTARRTSTTQKPPATIAQNRSSTSTASLSAIPPSTQPPVRPSQPPIVQAPFQPKPRPQATQRPKAPTTTTTTTTPPQNASIQKMTLPRDLIKKTSVNELKPFNINPFKIEYGQGKGDIDRQATEIINYFREFINAYPNKNIAITYSANTDQYKDIYRGYHTGEYKIVGANQAAVMGKVAQWIQENNLQNSIHIIPIPTCLHAGGKEPPTDHDIFLAIDNLQYHVNEGWHVLGLQNQDSTPDQPFAIGGGKGVAKDVWNDKNPQKVKVDNEMIALTQRSVFDLPEDLSSHTAAPTPTTPTTTTTQSVPAGAREQHYLKSTLKKLQ